MKTGIKLFIAYSRAIHWRPLGIIEAENYAGAVLMTAFVSLYEISMFANDEFGLGFGGDLNDMQSRFVAYVRRFST